MEKVLILALLVIGFQKITANCCGLESCHGAEHIDCIIGDADNWGEKCPDKKKMLSMRNYRDLILERHNEYRNKIAGGQVAGFEPAKRMGTLVWNESLAKLAKKNVRQCEMKHDGCRNTPEFDFVGQNLAYKKYSKSMKVNNFDIILELIDLWYSEIQFANADNINPFTAHSSSELGHFTQMMKDYSTRVGCAASKWTEGDDEVLLFACNYDITNILNFPTYKEGKAATGCKTGKHAIYKNLCSTKEVFNVNKFWEE